MNFPVHRSIFAALSVTAATLAFPLIAPAQLPQPAPAQAQQLDFQALEKGKQAIDDQKYPEAIAAFEELLKKYPQSPTIPEGTFRLGYAYYLSGDYDKSVEYFEKVPNVKGAPQELIEMAMSLAPQVISTKAAKLDPKDPARDKAFTDAVGQFDSFLTKFPQSDEVEAANFGKAMAFFQLQKFDEAVQPLRLNLQKFPQSETIQDTQYTLALVLGTDAITVLQKNPDTPDPAALAKFDEGEKILRDIITKRVNVAVMNDAQFQLGEMLSARASFMDAEKDKDPREAMLKRAIEAYRAVATKDQVVAAQKARIESIKQRRQQVLVQQRDIAQGNKLQRLQNKEQEKLAGFEGRPDSTLMAKLKTGQVFFQLGKVDESRVLLSYIEPNSDTAETKKEVAYYITMTYALQFAMDKAEERYKQFQGEYKGDPIAQNLQLVMAAGFMGPKDPSQQNPEKAIEYCKEGLAIYEKGRFGPDLLNLQASAFISMKRYDEALEMLKKFIDSKPAKELAASAEFNLALLYKDTGKTDESIKTFQSIREKYPNTQQAEQAHFWTGQLLLEGNPKDAVTELKAFTTKYPKSELMAQAMFALGQAQSRNNQADDALATYTELQKNFPKSEPAPFTFFERARIMNGKQQLDDCLTIMKEFISTYPDSQELYRAYDFMAQILGAQQKGMESIELYNEYLQKRPSEPSSAEALLKLSALWKGYADAQGPVLAQSPEKRAEWTKGIENASTSGEKIVDQFPESPTVALALNNLLDIQKIRLRSRLTTDADVEKFFNDLAGKASGKPATESKIRFTLAAFVAQKDKKKAKELMDAAYKSDLKYAPEDVDLYGSLLLAAKDYDKALALYQKLAKDYATPAGMDPKKASRQIQEAQGIALAGMGNALLGKKETGPAAEKFKELEENYAWSPKMMEVNYGVAKDLHDKKQDDEALRRLREVVKNANASSELRANSMLLMGIIQEEASDIPAAIDNFIKIGTFYQGVPEAAAEGLWRGAQLLERQARGEFPMPTPPPKAAPAQKTAPKPGAAPAAKPGAAPAAKPAAEPATANKS